MRDPIPSRAAKTGRTTSSAAASNRAGTNAASQATPPLHERKSNPIWHDAASILAAANAGLCPPPPRASATCPLAVSARPARRPTNSVSPAPSSRRKWNRRLRSLSSTPHPLMQAPNRAAPAGPPMRFIAIRMFNWSFVASICVLPLSIRQPGHFPIDVFYRRVSVCFN